MTLYLPHVRHEQNQNTNFNTYVTCYGADGHTKAASARRIHKAATSQFGQVKLQLKSETLKKVTLSNSSGHGRPSGRQRKEDDSSKTTSKAVPALSKPRNQPRKPSLCLTNTGLRQELMETMQLYRVPLADAVLASADLVCPDNSLVSVLKKSKDFSAAGVIAISFWPPDGHIRVLMTQECGRKSSWHKKMVKAKVWNNAKPFGILGGKRHKVENSPRVTALREVTEETAGLLSADNMDLPHSAIFLKAPANYFAFLYKLEHQNDLPETFSKLLADPNSNLAGTCTTKALAWVPVRDLARLPRAHFFDKLMRESIIPAWLCAQQREHDQQALESGVAEADAVILRMPLESLAAIDADAQVVPSLVQLQDLASHSSRSEPLHVIASVHHPRTLELINYVTPHSCSTGPAGQKVIGATGDPHHASHGDHVSNQGSTHVGRHGSNQEAALSVDMLLPYELLSGLLTQVSVQPEMLSVVNELFDTEGVEIHLRDPARYNIPQSQSQVSFSDVQEAARAHKKTAVGYLLQDGTALTAPHAEHMQVMQPRD